MLQHPFQIYFHFQSKISLKNRKALKAFISEKLSNLDKVSRGVINYIFCNDDALLQINRNYLKHNYYTDIITFDLSDKDSGILNADIYISTERVKDNAHIHEVSLQGELHRVIFHGILHLSGVKDKTPSEKDKMGAAENKWLSEYLREQP